MSARLLEKLHTNGPAPYNICTQLTNQERYYLLRLMYHWPDSTGHPDYPFAASATLGHVVTAFWLRGHVYTAALAVITYLVACLGMVIYALA